MTNDEVYNKVIDGFIEVGTKDEEALRLYIKRAVNFVQFNLGLPAGLASKHVYNIFISYRREYEQIEEKSSTSSV